MRPHAATLIPLGAFLALLTLAAVSSTAIRSKPLAQVYAQTHALAAAFQSGDVDAILALQQPATTVPERARRAADVEAKLATLRGRAYVVVALDLHPDGSYVGRIRWLPAAVGGGAWALDVHWVRNPQGAWRLG